MKMYQASLNGDQFSFVEINEISPDLFIWNSKIDFNTNNGLHQIYYDKGIAEESKEELVRQCQQYFK